MEQMMQDNILVALVFLAIGFVLLVKGADFFVEGSSSVAKRLKVPSIIIGLTIVAMGTSLPEAAVSISASIQHNNTLAVSNVVGSNIFNLMVVIGVCAYMTFVPISENTLKKDFPLSIVCAVLLLLLGTTEMEIGRLDGAILVAVFAWFLFYMIKTALDAKKKGEVVTDEEVENTPILPVWKCMLFIVGGAAAVAFGGDVVVDSASTIATSVGISPTLVGLTIVSIGTSLPELVTSVVAAKKNEVDMALGNAIGSNIFNILLVLGVSSVVSPVALIEENLMDAMLLIIFSIFVWLRAKKKNGLDKADGVYMVFTYILYMVYICIR